MYMIQTNYIHMYIHVDNICIPYTYVYDTYLVCIIYICICIIRDVLYTYVYSY